MNWDQIDIYEALSSLTETPAWYWSAETGKLRQSAFLLEPRSPWVYHHPDYFECGFCSDILFKRFGLLPSKCMQCFKVVVVPRTVDELFQLNDIEEQLPGMPCKCGIEVREDVARNYGGYFYNEGLEKGRACYTLIRDLIDKYISPDIKVYLKRACTEFERKFGPSDEWTLPEGQEVFEARLRGMIEDRPPIIEPPPDLVKHVKQRWVKFAHSIGDMTYLKYTDGKPLYEPYVIYAGAL